VDLRPVREVPGRGRRGVPSRGRGGRRPHLAAVSGDTVELIIRRKDLAGRGLDAGPHTFCWHLEHHHQVRVSAATVSRYLTCDGLVVPEPRKRPRSSCTRFAAELPTECWQSDFTHYRLTRPDGSPGADKRSSVGRTTRPA
jgi:hypothetical protein